MRLVLFVIALALPGVVLAQDLNLPERVEDRARRAPAEFLQDMAGLILGHGSAGGIDAAGLQQSVDVRRAAIRAREVQRLQKADLDGDQLIARSEVAVLQSLSTVGVRGRLEVAFRAADMDASGAVDPGELVDHATRVARRELSTRRASDLLAVMALDRDRDGFVTLDEVAAFLARLSPET